ncbi:protein MIZU-KUSSEI 1-like [Humulus lupulus]|uniref:protein MIZU-KUSSEI 1-like n=1 Tax=Humulus lupulus TaxID=3486 RepID=UPI002B400645|nr:protein MIZU-KUSSEI 1-like [Humulus lupulus]
MRMIDLGSQTLQIMDTATSVDCARQVRFPRRSLRALVECIVPACCGFQQTTFDDSSLSSFSSSPSSDAATTSTSGREPTRLTGTFFGYRKGRVSFCLQEHSRSSPMMLLEFAVPTAYLAREMQYGLLRIALECCHRSDNNNKCSLFRVPVWTMYCNGRKVGFAIAKQLSLSDVAVLNHMQSVSVGAGVLPDGDLMYMRAGFERVIGSPDSESFHMINPTGSSSAQQLSIFLLRSS